MEKDNTSQSRLVKRKKKKRTFRKRALFILIPILVAFLSIIGYGTYLYMKADTVMSESYEDDGREKSELREVKVDPTEDNVSILIIGVDENNHRDNEGSARSDALMVATLNKEDKSVNLVSIPRDSYVYIPEVGYEDKINHAHAFGGPQATIGTVENLLDIPIDYWVKVNFHAFVDVVDALNGVTAEVPYEFYESNSMDQRNAIHLLPGEQELNGEEALALARTRKLDNDIERGKRQQELIKAVVDKAASANSVFKFDNIIDAVGENMTTNMTFDEMKSFISYGTDGKNIDINTHTLEGNDWQPESTYYWQLDQVALNETKSMLKSHLELEGENGDSESETGETESVLSEGTSNSY
ncbi:LCP family protein [Oceanobacillus halotolerans]|uniref:LCP family protein n=1 Tax=Oceanobacillus halotolerans TaxID=2663380 RepID=UPI0013D9F5BF|nr:LCP family protein [Oceanobacillus halotolerans]